MSHYMASHYIWLVQRGWKFRKQTKKSRSYWYKGGTRVRNYREAYAAELGNGTMEPCS